MCLSSIGNYRPLNNWSGQGSRLSDSCPWWPSNLAMDMLWLNVGETSTPTANLVSIHPYPCYTSAFCLRHCAPTFTKSVNNVVSIAFLKKALGAVWRLFAALTCAPLAAHSKSQKQNVATVAARFSMTFDLKLHSDLESEHSDSDASSYKC